MAGWLDNDDEIQRNVGKMSMGGGFAPKRIDGPKGVSSVPDDQDADDSFEVGRRSDGKENEGLPIRRKKSMPPPSAPPGNAPAALPIEKLDKAREALRTSQERRLSSRPSEDDRSAPGSILAKEDGEKAEYTDEDLDELLREEADVIAHPSVNMSRLRGNHDDNADDSDESVEGSDIDGEMEKILGEADGVGRMPGPRKDGDQRQTTTTHVSWCTVAHENGESTDRVQCTLLRDRFSSRMYPEYQLVLDSTKQPVLLGRKQSMNTTSNYHVFDLTRGALSVRNQKYTKKSGNYLGKLRASSMESLDYVLVTKAAGRQEVLAVSYERPSMMSQIVDGSQPRKLNVVIPHLDADSVPVPRVVTVGKGSISGSATMAEYLTDPVAAQAEEFYSLVSKEPVFEKGNYRLNFYGRVSKPSVKNFQIVSVDDPDDIICQFGKVGEDKFHLDFKAPMTAFQAFGVALTQFNL